MATKIQIGDTVLEIQPTINGYSKTLQQIGTKERALNGTLHSRIRAIKRVWEITGYVRGQKELIESLPDSGSFSFTDVDGVVYIVMCTNDISFDKLGAYTMTLEEV